MATIVLLLLSSVALAYGRTVILRWLERRELRYQLEAVKYVRTPPAFFSDFPGDRTVQERADAFRELLRMSGNRWFHPEEVRLYVYAGRNGAPNDKNPVGVTFELWQQQVWADYQAFVLAWAEGKGRAGQHMSDEAIRLFENQRRGFTTGWQKVEYR